MTGHRHLSFSVKRSELADRILIPKYYSPEIEGAISAASDRFELPKLADLLETGAAGSRLGTWIPREHYGSGQIPFVRTSDFNAWRVRPDFKKSVSSEIFEKVRARQDITSGDILMVAHGTYLVGTVAIVTSDDMPLVLQDHVFRLRLRSDLENSFGFQVSNWLVLAALTSKFVRRQVRARQFSADIIDKIGERHLGLRIPIPKDAGTRSRVERLARLSVEGEYRVRKQVSGLLGSDLRMSRERAEARHGFAVKRSEVRRRILVPKYYDPVLGGDIRRASQRDGGWMPLGHLLGSSLTASTGVEVGKMAYGTGTIPFVRTSDIADLMVKSDPRQGVSDDVFSKYKHKASIKKDDILLVRDGTYLVGSSAIVADDIEAGLICGGLYRLRVSDEQDIDPYWLLAVLNIPLVRRQLRARQFTRDVIDTLGDRLFEVLVPNSNSPRYQILGQKLRHQLARRKFLRDLGVSAVGLVEPQVSHNYRQLPAWSMRA